VRIHPGVRDDRGIALLTLLYGHEHHTEGSEKLTRRLLSCGREIIGVEVRVVNEEGRT